MNFQEYTQYDAMGLAELIKKGEVSAKEVLQSAIDRANLLNPNLNAIIHRFDEKALANANQLPNGVFTGVPYLLKDLLYEYAGEPLKMGSRSINVTPTKDNEIVKRMKATGVNTFGKTNTPEFGLIITTEPKSFGATHNPHKHGYSTGGSSGGSACVVASGIVPMAGGGDGGGSIRFPASWCGVFGLKPTSGRTPLSSVLGEDWNGAVANHVITRSVRDSALMLDAISGREIGSPYVIGDSGNHSFYHASQTAPKPLRIALHKKPLITNTEIHPDVMATLEQTAKRLADMGHIVEEADPNIDIHRMWQDFLYVVASHTAHTIDDIARTHGKQHINNLEPQTYNIAMLGRSLSAVDLLNAKQGWQSVRYHTDVLLSQYDVILCPTVPTPAVPLGILPPKAFDETMMKVSNPFKLGKLLLKSGMVEKLSHPVQSKMAFTMLANITGMPAMSVPLGMSGDGLPIGMQFIARLNDEATLYSLAGQMERAGWFTDLSGLLS
ncbi:MULTISPECIES: amidase [unclassified Moraxella]|uniref:amidase n=1 Tax=unclassified Moraxella TaxID=2685852 RepID=UPI003AF98B05